MKKIWFWLIIAFILLGVFYFRPITLNVPLLNLPKVTEAVNISDTDLALLAAVEQGSWVYTIDSTLLPIYNKCVKSLSKSDKSSNTQVLISSCVQSLDSQYFQLTEDLIQRLKGIEISPSLVDRGREIVFKPKSDQSYLIYMSFARIASMFAISGHCSANMCVEAMNQSLRIGRILLEANAWWIGHPSEVWNVAIRFTYDALYQWKNWSPNQRRLIRPILADIASNRWTVEKSRNLAASIVEYETQERQKVLKDLDWKDKIIAFFDIDLNETKKIEFTSRILEIEGKEKEREGLFQDLNKYTSPFFRKNYLGIAYINRTPEVEFYWSPSETVYVNVFWPSILSSILFLNNKYLELSEIEDSLLSLK